MTALSRFAWRLRRGLLRAYEFALYAMLLALAAGVVLAVAPAAGQGDDGYCGNSQNSAAVVTR